jgi:hypothetical protein
MSTISIIKHQGRLYRMKSENVMPEDNVITVFNTSDDANAFFTLLKKHGVLDEFDSCL